VNPFRKLWDAIGGRMHDRQVTRMDQRRTRRASRPAPPAGAGILRVPRRIALAVIAILITAASCVSFAESYRGLYLWAAHHGLSGIWAGAFPAQIDVFIAVGELSLFVALVDRWRTRSRGAAWLVTLAGLAVSVVGNVGHVTGHSAAVRATAAVPPLAASAALAVGLGVLKRVVEKHHREDADDVVSSPLPATDENAPHEDEPVRPPDVVSSPVPGDAETAAVASLKATLAAGNPWSVNQLSERFSLTRTQATRIRRAVLAGANGHHP
jgi:Protein of unknown function (DUF2637)